MSWTIIHNPRCSKSRASLQKLQDHGIEPEIREYLHNPLSEEELTTLLQKLNLPASALVRTKEEDYKENPFDLDDVKTVVAELAKRPKLQERPIIIKNDVAVIGRPPENIDQIL